MKTNSPLSLQGSLFRLCLTVILALLPNNASAQNGIIQIVTEEAPPYSFSEDGKVKGLCTEIIEAVLKEVHMQGQIQILPWARAYDMALNSENVLIYSIGRTAPREKLFHWLYIMKSSNSYLFAMHDKHIKLAHLDQARSLQIATINDDMRELFLLSKGFVKGVNLQSGPKYQFGYEKLKSGRVDLWATSEIIANYLVRKTGDDSSKALDPVLRLEERASNGVYMAFGAKTSDAMVQRFRKGLEAIKKNGVFDVIVKKWQ
jgi:polar amino acid transport system substrate-binding protein